MTKVLIRGNRYYEEELEPNAFKLIKEAFLDINSLKRETYNILFDKKYDYKKFITKIDDENYCRYLSSKFNINAYYLANSITTASGILSSQMELKKDYIYDKKNRIKSIEDKIISTQKKLENKMLIKKSLITYSKTGKWIKPYPKNSMIVIGHIVKDLKRDFMDIDEFETKYVDIPIRKLKHRIKMLQDRLKRENIKLSKLLNNKPKRVVFGSKAMFKLKDTMNGNLDSFKNRRNRTVVISGRKDSKYGNFLINYDVVTKDLKWRLPYGKEVMFPNFKLWKNQNEFDKLFYSKPNMAIAYQFTFYIDGNGKEYIVPSVIIEEENDKYINYDYSEGSVNIDINSNHISYSEIDNKGLLLQHGVVKLDLYNKSSNQARQIINDACAKIAKLCVDTNKPLIMEDISTKSSKSKMSYEPKRKNRVSSLFAYKKITEGMISQSKKHKFNIMFINPAYTSFIGKIRFMRIYGLSIHEAAAYTIGLKGLELVDIKKVPEEYKNIAKTIPSLYKKINKYKKHKFYLKTPIFNNKKELETFFN